MKSVAPWTHQNSLIAFWKIPSETIEILALRNERTASNFGNYQSELRIWIVSQTCIPKVCKDVMATYVYMCVYLLLMSWHESSSSKGEIIRFVVPTFYAASIDVAGNAFRRAIVSIIDPRVTSGITSYRLHLRLTRKRTPTISLIATHTRMQCNPMQSS